MNVLTQKEQHLNYKKSFIIYININDHTKSIIVNEHPESIEFTRPWNMIRERESKIVEEPISGHIGGYSIQKNMVCFP